MLRRSQMAASVYPASVRAERNAVKSASAPRRNGMGFGLESIIFGFGRQLDALGAPVAVCDLGDGDVGQTRLVEHLPHFFQSEGGVKRIRKEGALQRTPRYGVLLNQLLQGLLGFGTHQIT